jgi:hypothetical protein
MVENVGVQVPSDRGRPVGERIRGHTKSRQDVLFAPRCKAVQPVNAMRDANGIGYARKAMIRCGLWLDVTGRWHVPQLSVELQQIVGKHRPHFEGEAVAPCHARISSEDNE